MPSVTPRTGAAAPSCWTTEYWLRHCDGYRVWGATGPIGYVETVLSTEDGEPHSLVVRVGSSAFSQLLTLPVEAVESFDPATERVFVSAIARNSDQANRQLRIPALA